MLETIRVKYVDDHGDNPIHSADIILPAECATYKREREGLDVIELELTSDDAKQISVGSYIIYRDRCFRLNRLPVLDKSDDVNYKYTYVFEGGHYLLKDNLWLNQSSGSMNYGLPHYDFYGTPKDFIDQLCAAANAVPGKPHSQSFINGHTNNAPGLDFTPVDGYTTKYFGFSIYDTTLYDALTQVADLLGCDYVIQGAGAGDGTTETDNGPITRMYVYLTREPANPAASPYTFSFGQGKGLYSITAKPTDDKNTITRLYVFGGSTNLPPTTAGSRAYRDGSTRLRMPAAKGDYIDIHDPATDYVEPATAVKVFDSIYPSMTDKGVIASILATDRTKCVDTNALFDYEAAKVGTEAKINFLTGLLAGRSFSYNYDAATKTFTLIKQDDPYGVVTDTTLTGDADMSQVPNNTYYPQAGDKYNLTGIIFPQSFIDSCEAELQTAGEAYAASLQAHRVALDAKIDGRYVLTNGWTLDAGTRLTVTYPNGTSSITEQMRINSISENVGTGEIEATIGDYVPWSKYDELNADISSLRQEVSSSNSGNSGTAEALYGLALIRYDGTTKKQVGSTYVPNSAYLEIDVGIDKTSPASYITALKALTSAPSSYDNSKSYYPAYAADGALVWTVVTDTKDTAGIQAPASHKAFFPVGYDGASLPTAATAATNSLGAKFYIDSDYNMYLNGECISAKGNASTYGRVELTDNYVGYGIVGTDGNYSDSQTIGGASRNIGSSWLALVNAYRSLTQVSGVPTTQNSNPSLLEKAVINTAYSNKFWFLPPEKISVETSTDAETWTEVTVSDSEKKKLVAGNGSFTAPTSFKIPAESYMRMTFAAPDTYCFVDMLYIYISQGRNYFKIEKYKNGTWTTVVDYASSYLSPSPGHIVLRHPWIGLLLNDADTVSYHNSKIRLTIHNVTGCGTTTIYDLQWWGSFPAQIRDIYSWDGDKNVTFPAGLKSATLTVTGASALTTITGLTELNAVAIDTWKQYAGITSLASTTKNLYLVAFASTAAPTAAYGTTNTLATAYINPSLQLVVGTHNMTSEIADLQQAQTALGTYVNAVSYANGSGVSTSLAISNHAVVLPTLWDRIKQTSATAAGQFPVWDGSYWNNDHKISDFGTATQQTTNTAAITSLQNTVAGHTTSIANLNTAVVSNTTSINSIDNTLAGYGDIVTHSASEFAAAWTGALAVSNGGTGRSSFAVNSFVVGGTTTTGALAQITDADALQRMAAVLGTAFGATGNDYIVTYNGTTLNKKIQFADTSATGDVSNYFLNRYGNWVQPTASIHIAAAAEAAAATLYPIMTTGNGVSGSQYYTTPYFYIDRRLVSGTTYIDDYHFDHSANFYDVDGQVFFVPVLSGAGKILVSTAAAPYWSNVNGLLTSVLTVNGTAYNVYKATSANTSIYAPTSLGAAGKVLAVDSAGTGLTWISVSAASGIIVAASNSSGSYVVSGWGSDADADGNLLLGHNLSGGQSASGEFVCGRYDDPSSLSDNDFCFGIGASGTLKNGLVVKYASGIINLWADSKLIALQDYLPIAIKGIVAAVANLPTSGLADADRYYVTATAKIATYSISTATWTYTTPVTSRDYRNLADGRTYHYNGSALRKFLLEGEALTDKPSTMPDVIFSAVMSNDAMTITNIYGKATTQACDDNGNPVANTFAWTRDEIAAVKIRTNNGAAATYDYYQYSSDVYGLEVTTTATTIYVMLWLN